MKQTVLLLEYLYQALASEYGIVVSVTPYNTALQALYAARRSSTDPALRGLQFRKSPVNPQTEIWIVKDGKQGGSAAGETSRESVPG